MPKRIPDKSELDLHLKHLLLRNPFMHRTELTEAMAAPGIVDGMLTFPQGRCNSYRRTSKCR